MNLQEEIARVYQGLQHLDMPPTKNNLAIVLDALQVLEIVHEHLANNQKEVKTEDAAENHPE